MGRKVVGVSCEVCGQQRAPGTIHSRDSKLIKNQKILICERCESLGFEPRHFIILMILSKGLESVSDYIKHHRYPGDKIDVLELVE